MATEKINIRVTDNGSSRIVQRDLAKIGTSASGALTAVKLLTVGLAALALFKVTKDAIAFESALVGVQKTTGFTDKEMKSLGREFQNLSRTIPLTSTELAKIGEVAGQLGIKGVENIVAFTDTVAKVASTTDFTVEAAAADLARLAILFNVPIKEVNRLASAMNALENSTTANAPTIAEFSKRMAGAAIAIGLTGAEVTGIAATLDRLGAKAEAGSSVMIRVFSAMISKAGEFATQMGISTGEFRDRLAEDAVGTLEDFLKVLNRLNTPEAVAFLDKLGLKGVRALPVMLLLRKNFTLLRKNVDTANKAFEEGTSIEKEFAVQVRSTANQSKLLANEITIVSQTIGTGFLPAIKQATKEAKLWVRSLSEDEFRLRNLGAFLGGTFLDIMSLVADAFSSIRAAMDLVAGIALKVTANLGLLLIPFANLTDLLGITDNATEDLIKNLDAMNEAGSELFKEAEKRVESFKTGIINANIEVETILKNLEKTDEAGNKLGGKTGRDIISKGPKGVGSDDLEDLISAGAITGTDLFIQKLELINKALKANQINAAQASRAIQEFSVLNEGPEESQFQDIIDAGAITGTDLFIKQLERINEAFLNDEISAEQASRAIQAFSVNNQGAAEEVEGLAEVLRASETPLDRLSIRLERVADLFERGFIDDEQASVAIRKFTDSYNREIDRMTEKTDDAAKDIKDAIKSLANSMESRMTDTFFNLIKGTNTFKQTFISLIDEMIKQVLRLAVVKPLVEGLFGGGSSGGGGILGSVITSFFAPGGGAGGVVASGAVSSLPLAPSFGEGGEFKVGGIGGTDSQRRTIAVSPDETVRITTPSQERMQGMMNTTNHLTIITNISGGQEDSSSSGDAESQEFGLQAANMIKSTVLDMMRPDQPLGKAFMRKNR